MLLLRKGVEYLQPAKLYESTQYKLVAISFDLPTSPSFSALSRIISISTSSILSRIVARSYIDPSHVKVVESVIKEMLLHPGKAGCKELDNFQRIPLPYGENCNIATMRKLKRSLIGAYGWIMMCCKQRHPGTTSSSHHSAV
jgi:hypothetical protein